MRHELFPVFGVGAVYVVMVYLAGSFVLQQFPNSADEFAYLYQANAFASGNAVNEAHPQQEALSPFFIHTHNGKVFSIFPPGWAAVLSIGVLLHLPWLINPLIAGLSVIILYKISRHFFDQKWSWAVLGIWMLSPMVVLNSASLFSHPLCTLLILLTLWGLIRFQHLPKLTNAIFVGLVSAFAFSTRELTSTALLCIPMLYAFIQTPKKYHYLGGIILGALPISVLYGWYCAQTTGIWFYPPRYLLRDEYLGFGWREIHLFDYTEQNYFGPFEAWLNTSSNLYRLLQGSTLFFPVLLCFGLFPVWKNTWMRLFLLSSFLLLGVYVLYPSDGGNQYGARFYEEALPLMALMLVYGIQQSRWMHFNINGWKHKLIIAAAIALILTQYYSFSAVYDQIYQRRELFRLVEHKHLQNAIVFVSSPSGGMTQGDLIRNLPGYQNAPVIYAWHLDTRNRELMNAFPNRSYYLFIRDEQTGLPTLIPIHP
jgi:hypothetical protein